MHEEQQLSCLCFRDGDVYGHGHGHGHDCVALYSSHCFLDCYQPCFFLVYF